MGRPPTLKNKARELARRQEAMHLLAKGEPITSIAERLSVSTRAVRLYLRRAIESESFYPNNLAPERVAELRVIEGERLTKLWQKAQLALDQIQPRLGSEGERNNDGLAVARLIESGTRVSERIARLFGLDQPTKVVADMLLVSYQKIDKKVTISFDRSPIEALARQPVPGLSVTIGSSLNGNGHIAAALPNAPINDSGAIAVCETAEPLNGTETASR